MDQDELLGLVTEVLERLSIPYLVTGSMATILYGEPRFTNDIDIVVQLANRAKAMLLVAAFPPPDFYVAAEAALRAATTKSQFNLIHPRSGLKVDFMVAAMDAFDRSRFRRGRRALGDERPTVFASPEDVIVKKLQFYADGGSDKHLRDIAGVLKITGDVDRDYVSAWAERLGVADVWRVALKRAQPG